MSDVLRIERQGPIEIWTITRPKALNALNAAVIDALTEAAIAADADADLRAIVLTGEGKAFVAGADIAAMQSLTPAEAGAFAAKGQAMGERFERLGVPVIAAVNGFALGGGCELAMSCDIVIAGARAKFGQPEVNLGVIPGFGGTQRLARRVGATKALDLCLTGRFVGAEEAVSMGLAARRVEGDVVEEALAIARTIAAKGPVAVSYAKRAIHENADADLSTGLAAERNLFALCFATSDQSEGMTAFLEKRAAEFTGA
ncbi:MAG: enoyl-CoA hydratase/isomerase family protein [Proteobacteria bacterium]|nr:enoyl-CoA hydratase/isomerase family protein [Pseudomonadota bacterium]